MCVCVWGSECARRTHESSVVSGNKDYVTVKCLFTKYRTVCCRVQIVINKIG